MIWWKYLILSLLALIAVGIIYLIVKIIILVIRRIKFLRYSLHIRKFHDSVTQGHPQIVYGETETDFKTIGMTSAPATDNVQNIPMSENAEPGNTDTSYMIKRPRLISKKKRNSVKEGWGLSKADYKKAGKVALRKPKRTKPKKKHKKRRLVRHR